MTLRLIFCWFVFAVLLSGCTRPTPTLEQELDALLQLLPGRYAGEAPDARSPEGASMAIFHKIVPIDAPQFGAKVFYYQLSRGSADGPALQQKIFVFDTASGRSANRMRAWVFAPGQADGNLESAPARVAALRPDELMSFPEACAFLWSRIGDTFEGVVSAENCGFRSRQFNQEIRPDMRYRVNADRFEWNETLYGEGRRVIATTDGSLIAFRE